MSLKHGLDPQSHPARVNGPREPSQISAANPRHEKHPPQLAMTITIVFDGVRFFVDHNPAVVATGDSVDWIIWYCGPVRSGDLRWALRFANPPFQFSAPPT